MQKQIILFLITCISICACREPAQENPTNNVPGNKIVFLMGHDKGDSSYFEYAEEYYRTSDSTAGFEVVKHCRTIEDVINFINESDTTYSSIDIVAHGNSATGLNLYLSEGGHKATPKRMVQEVILRDLPRLNAGVVDSTSSIRIWSCGIGSNPLITYSLPMIFKTEDGEQAKVECSEHFVVYKPNSEGKIERYAAAYYPYQYRRGQKPATSIIAQDMKKRFPDVDIDWSAAMTDEENFIDYHLPISFTRSYEKKDDRPDLGEEPQRLAYVQAQPEITEQLDEIDMDYDDFSWSVTKRKELQADGTYAYSVKAIGMTTLLCFLDLAD